MENNYVFSNYSFNAFLKCLVRLTKGKTQSEIKTIVEEIKDDHLEVFEALVLKDHMQLKTDDLEVIVNQNTKEATNLWVKQKTNGMIDSILDKNVDACLVNAMYFNEKWTNKTNRFEGWFKNNNGSKRRCQMLSSLESYYLENEDYTGFIKNMTNDYEFVVLLPKKEFKEVDFKQIVDSRILTNVQVNFPEFSITSTFFLKEYLNKAGVKKIFTLDADFSNLMDQPFHLEEIVQKTKIEITKYGVEAASANAGIAYASIPMDLKEIVVNRPFLFAIMNKDRNLILSGKVRSLE